MVGQHGSWGIMELVEHCTECSTVSDSLNCLTDTFRCLHTDSFPCRRPAEDVGALILSRVCILQCDRREYVSVGQHGDTCVELTYLSLTLVEKITSSMTFQSLPPAVHSYFRAILRVLFQDMDLMPHLVHQFQSEDQFCSHLAAKSASACVLYHLNTSGAVSPVWEQKCVQAFHSALPSPELDACLWSLTEVLKRLLKGGHREIVVKLLISFDTSLSSLCSRFLSAEGKEAETHLMGWTSSTHWGNTLCLLLDLLEVLTASGLICGADTSVRSQRLTYIHSSGLLRIIGSSSEYFVKKRMLLLLKRAVLQKAGEDWSLGDVLLSGTKYEHFNSDLSRLAQTVLTAVAANWLQSVHVESASFFGGTRNFRGHEGAKPDCVTLRGVSLLLLKSMELHIQTTDGAGSTSEDYAYLQSLWSFLKRHSFQLLGVSHLCSWLSLTFGEQDDDMMEAAKALLSIFLHHRKCSGLQDVALLEASCSSGCNPHCHFLLLLQSVSFDHSILLDFLISTETCFLEYFVRYLKYLITDWHGFMAACGQITGSDPPLSLQNTLFSTSYADHKFTPTCEDEPHRAPAVEMGSLAPEHRLVEYSSSDESDPESMDERGTSFNEKSKLSELNVREINRPSVTMCCQSTGLPRNSAFERRPEEAKLLPNMTVLSGHVSCQTSARAVRCLSELREVVTRLQTKNLFPYNPSSLLKLLVKL